jgi:hypothetical protein
LEIEKKLNLAGCPRVSGHAYVDSTIESGRNAAGKIESVSLSLPVEAAAVDSFVEELRQLENRGKPGTDGTFSRNFSIRESEAGSGQAVKS